MSIIILIGLTFLYFGQVCLLQSEAIEDLLYLFASTFATKQYQAPTFFNIFTFGVSSFHVSFEIFSPFEL